MIYGVLEDILILIKLLVVLFFGCFAFVSGGFLLFKLLKREEV